MQPVELGRPRRRRTAARCCRPSGTHCRLSTPVAADGGPAGSAAARMCRRRRHRRHVGYPGEVGGVAAELLGRDAGGIGNHDGDVGGRVDREVAAQLVADLDAPTPTAAARGRRGSPTWRPGTAHRAPAAARRSRAPTGIAWRITNFVERYQNVCSTGFGRRLRPAQHPTHQPRTSSESSRSPSSTIAAGVTTIAGDGRERHHRDSGVGERLQEVHREQHHRDHRQRDRHRREQHGATGGRHGADQRLVARRPSASSSRYRLMISSV